MTNVIAFHGKVKQTASDDFPCPKERKINKAQAFVTFIFSFIQISLILLWPFIRWFVYLDIIVLLLKVLFHTNNHAIFDFVSHSFIIFLCILLVFFFRSGSQKNK